VSEQFIGRPDHLPSVGPSLAFTASTGSVGSRDWFADDLPRITAERGFVASRDAAGRLVADSPSIITGGASKGLVGVMLQG
jgi:hypothetical protein